MNSFPRFMNKVKYPYYAKVIKIAMDFVEIVDEDIFVRDVYLLRYGKLDTEVIIAFNKELKRIGMRLEVDVRISEGGLGIETLLEIKQRRCGRDVGGDLRGSLMERVDIGMVRRYGNMWSDFFPPYFNVYYVFGNMRGKHLQKLRMKIYCFLEENDFPKKFNKTQIRLGMKEELYLKPQHYEQIRRELLFRGIQFEYYKNLFCVCCMYNSSSIVDGRLRAKLRFGYLPNFSILDW